jgi:hypothetical protein
MFAGFREDVLTLLGSFGGIAQVNHKQSENSRAA